MPRLSVGIDFPQELKLDLSKLCAGVPGAKWVRPCKFHLTLRFIGAVDDRMATNITDALLRIEASSLCCRSRVWVISADTLCGSVSRRTRH